MNNKLFEFNQAAPNRYIAHFYRECTVAEFLKIILETKPEDYGCIVIFDSKDYPLDSYHYKNGKIIHNFANEEADEKDNPLCFWKWKRDFNGLYINCIISKKLCCKTI